VTTPAAIKQAARTTADVDGGCIYCVSKAVAALMLVAPEHDWPHLVFEQSERTSEVEIRERAERMLGSTA
jgi:hypothetical protein